MKRFFQAASLTAVLILAFAGTARAQAGAMAPAAASAPAIPLEQIYRGSPGSSMMSPFAFGLGMGDVFISMNYERKRRALQDASGNFGPERVDDASLSLGFGLGDAHEMLGLTTIVTTPSPFRYGTGQGLSLSLALSHYIDPTFAVAVGVENAMKSGGRPENADSWYATASRIWDNPVEGLKGVIATLGVGNGRFRLNETVVDGEETPMAFGSIGLKFHEQVTLTTDWYGPDLGVEAAVTPFKGFPLVLTPALVDITHNANRTARFVLGASVAYHF